MENGLPIRAILTGEMDKIPLLIPLNTAGYPNDLNTTDANDTFGGIFKNKTTDWVRLPACPNGSTNICYRGPASDPDKGAKPKSPANLNKPAKSDYWEYNSTSGTFKLTQ